MVGFLELALLFLEGFGLLGDGVSDARQTGGVEGVVVGEGGNVS